MAEGATPTRRTRRGSGAVTLHDVAKLAAVAPITASRALNSPDQVSAEVLRRVRDAVARTGYVPNLLAGGLASTRSRLVAAVVPTISGPVFLESVQSLTEALAARGYQLMLGQAGYAGGREDLLLEAIVGRRPDGIVLTGIMHSAEGRRRLLASAIPVVETWDLTPTPIDMLVGFSHVEVGRAVAEFLYAKGRRRFAAVAGDDERAKRRFEAFQAGARSLGASGDIDAMFCSSDLLALGVLTEARVLGIRVPEQLAVVGFGDLEFAADVDPALTTVRINGAAIGEQAARFIVDRSEGRDVPQRVIDIGFSIVERSST
jgi:LacI family gluconate utilization system Gnt-I transcriptional repressor